MGKKDDKEEEEGKAFKQGWEDYETAISNYEAELIRVESKEQSAMRWFHIVQPHSDTMTRVEAERLEVWAGGILAVMFGAHAIALFEAGSWSRAYPDGRPYPGLRGEAEKEEAEE